MKTLLAVFLLLPLIGWGQFTYKFDQSIPVTDLNGNQLLQPWSGGLNAAQYNTMDLNHDDVEDLVLFDRMANRIITFTRDNGQWRFSPEYATFFPEILNFILLRDYNCDGKKDLFTGDNLGMRVYTNVTSGPVPEWELFLFSTTGFTSKSEVLLSKGFNTKVNVPLQFDDLPSVEDVDNDGDLDLLNMRFVGNGNLELHRNFSMERYGTCDSLDFERTTQTYGNVRECACGQFAFNGLPCGPVSGGRVQHAGGKSLLLIDANGDQNKDILISEAECGQLFLLPNQGDGLNPVFSSNTNFPISNPAAFLIYPTAYYEDVDDDGTKDLIVTPNAFQKEFMNMDLTQSNWFYRNNGTTGNPSFAFVQNDFLQEQMIDVGDNAVPAFADADGDGDFDLFVSNNYRVGYVSGIAFFENTGSMSTPAFSLRNEDYLGLSLSPLFNRKIQFTDIDNNGTIDLVFTATSFETGATAIYYIANKSQSALDFSGQNIIPVTFSLAGNENLHFTDVDGDGQPDILIGRSEGSIEYWRNQGALQFDLEDADYLGFGPSFLRYAVSLAVADLDSDGHGDLLIADQNGLLQVVSSFRTATDAAGVHTNVVYNPLLDQANPYGPANLSGRSWPAVVNLFGTTRPAVVAGTVLGGISVLRHDNGEALPDEPAISIYPNPVQENQIINVMIDRPAFFQIISSLGHQVSQPTRLEGFEPYQYNVSRLASGLYIFKFSVGKKTFSRKLFIP